MAAALRLTIQDLEGRPTPLDDQRYELIDGELSVSTQPHWRHQFSAANIIYALAAWSRQNAAGMVLRAPGVVFANDTAVAPDVVWVSKDRLDTVLGEDGKLHAAPDLVVELLSPGLENQRRDREAKLSLYSRQGVREYWIKAYANTGSSIGSIRSCTSTGAAMRGWNWSPPCWRTMCCSRRCSPLSR